MKRNVIFHCYPRRRGQKWRRSVAHLVRHWNQFTGRRVVSVALDDTTDTAEAVQEAFWGCPAEFIALRNTGLQEVESFPRLLEAVEPDRDSITLYAHSKGCTHHCDTAASHLWCDAMAEACLQYPELIDCALSEAATCGAFRSFMPIGDPRHSVPWHFAGTWWWVRNDALFARNWRNMDAAFFGAESYPGRQFRTEESRCLFFDHAETASLYDREYWSRAITPALGYWREAVQQCLTETHTQPAEPAFRRLPVLRSCR